MNGSEVRNYRKDFLASRLKNTRKPGSSLESYTTNNTSQYDTKRVQSDPTRVHRKLG